MQEQVEPGRPSNRLIMVNTTDTASPREGDIGIGWREKNKNKNALSEWCKFLLYSTFMLGGVYRARFQSQVKFKLVVTLRKVVTGGIARQVLLRNLPEKIVNGGEDQEEDGSDGRRVDSPSQQQPQTGYRYQASNQPQAQVQAQQMQVQVQVQELPQVPRILPHGHGDDEQVAIAQVV